MRKIKLKFALPLTLFLCSVSVAQKNPLPFKSEMNLDNGTVITTFLDISLQGDAFTITSPKNADLRMVGGKARLGRLMGKLPKKGIIMTISGFQKGDSLIGETKIPMLGRLKFNGAMQGQAFSGKLSREDGSAVGTLSGVQSQQQRLNFTWLYPKMMQTIGDNIYSKSALQTKEWKKFDKKIKALCAEAHDDIELFFGFNMLAQKLPFTHLTFLITQDEPDESNAKGETDDLQKAAQSVFFAERNPTTAYLKIRNFSSSEKELLETLPDIVSNPGYKNLIIDLRDNGGGGVGAAFALAKYIVTEDLEVGYFPTNKLGYSGFDRELFKTLPDMQPKSTDEFGNELRSSQGVKLVFKKPVNPVFNGNLYLLTNGKTGSTCEPIVYALKSNKRATIVGENTAGAMLSASPFVVEGKYMLMLPIGDFYTHDGVRLDKLGVAPDVEVKSEDAEKKALELIDQKRE